MRPEMVVHLAKNSITQCQNPSSRSGMKVSIIYRQENTTRIYLTGSMNILINHVSED